MKYLLTLVFKREKNMKNLLSEEVDADDPLTVAITNLFLGPRRR